MFDDFRQQADEATFEEEELSAFDQEQTGGALPALLARLGSRLPGDDFLGLTAQQRFVIALMLLLLTVMGGVAGLLLTGKMTLF